MCKKIVRLFALLLSLVFVVCACTSPQDSPTPEQTPEATPEQTTPTSELPTPTPWQGELPPYLQGLTLDMLPPVADNPALSGLPVMPLRWLDELENPTGTNSSYNYRYSSFDYKELLFNFIAENEDASFKRYSRYIKVNNAALTEVDGFDEQLVRLECSAWYPEYVYEDGVSKQANNETEQVEIVLSPSCILGMLGYAVEAGSPQDLCDYFNHRSEEAVYYADDFNAVSDLCYLIIETDMSELPSEDVTFDLYAGAKPIMAKSEADELLKRFKFTPAKLANGDRPTEFYAMNTCRYDGRAAFYQLGREPFPSDVTDERVIEPLKLTFKSAEYHKMDDTIDNYAEFEVVCESWADGEWKGDTAERTLRIVAPSIGVEMYGVPISFERMIDELVDFINENPNLTYTAFVLEDNIVFLFVE